jgi:dCMP deaminase
MIPTAWSRTGSARGAASSRPTCRESGYRLGMLESFGNKEPDDWDNIFFQEAALWSRKSHDSQTKCGCVLVKDRTVISSGYNGFIRGIDDDLLPNTRPDKYPFMIHAEANAVYNSVRIGRCTLDAWAYVTAVPCLQCLQMLYQCGISKVLFSNISDPKMCTQNYRYMTIYGMIKDKIELIYIPTKKLDSSYLQEAVKEIEKNQKNG